MVIFIDVVGHVSHVGTFYNTIETCRSADKCPGSDSTWCIHLYHPTEDIQLCLNESGIVNETDYARLLQLQCYFSVPNRTVSIAIIFVIVVEVPNNGRAPGAPPSIGT